LWQTTVFRHPVFLVTVQELEVERDSLALHVLSGVPEAARGTVVQALQAEPALWPNYGGWLAANEAAIWQEISRMAGKKGRDRTPTLKLLAEYLRDGGRVADFKSFLEAYGIKQLWADLSPEQREELRRLVRQDESSGPSEGRRPAGSS
jgi:hypothetical protein